VRTRRIHVFGASGAGVTTLGRALADALAVPHHDTDDYFWLPTTPPYHDRREVPERLRLMHAMFVGRPAWVLSGSLDGWGDPLIRWLDHVVFLYVPPDIRVARLRERETRREGAAVAPGGWRHAESEAFIEWASHYDDGTREGRSLPRHQAWMQTLACPILRLDGTQAVAVLVARCVATVT